VEFHGAYLLAVFTLPWLSVCGLRYARLGTGNFPDSCH
jgi:hypothetical protein